MRINIERDFETIECCSCGIAFAISSEFKGNLRETKKTFHCPNGHPQSYTKSVSDILKEQILQKEKVISDLRIKNVDLEYELSKKKRAKKNK